MNRDIIKGFRWEDYFPVLEAFQKRVPIIYPSAGDVLVNESFDAATPVYSWWKVYSLGKDQINERIVDQGRAGSKALQIDNCSLSHWVKEYDHWVAVTPGNVFAYRGFCRVEKGPSGKAHAFMGITLYNARREAIEWNSARSIASFKEGEPWQAMSGRLIVPTATSFIRFRISGEEQGKVCFDDIRLWREK